MTTGEARAEVMRWRKDERQRLIAARLAVDAATRAAWSDAIAGHLDSAIGDVAGLVVSAYWPFRGELRAACRCGEGQAAGLPQLARRRAAGARRLEHPGAGGWRRRSA